jgi:hypothetical protein
VLRHLELDRLQIRLQRVPHSSEARVGVCLLPLPLRWKQKRLGAISERDLVYWATMLLLNDAYELDPSDEDFIAEWLNDISYSLDAT